MTVRAGVLALLALATPAALFADDLISADRPGLANGSSTVGRGTFQVEAGFYRDSNDDDVRGIATPYLFRLGLTDALELRAEGDGYQRATAPHVDPATGWAPISAGFKYRLREEGHGGPEMSVIGRVFPSSGSRDFKSAHTTGDLVLTADETFAEHWTVNPNVGLAWLDDGGRFTAALAALTIQYSIRPTVGVFVDGAWQRPEAPSTRSAAILDLGSAWVVGRDAQLDVSFGWGVAGEAVAHWFWSAGVSRRF